MEESCKIPALGAKAQMCQAALALDEERAALGVQVLRFSVCIFFFTSYGEEEAAYRCSALPIRRN